MLKEHNFQLRNPNGHSLKLKEVRRDTMSINNTFQPRFIGTSNRVILFLLHFYLLIYNITFK